MDEGFDVLGLNALETGQGAALARAHLMKPEAAFSSLACWALGAALISLECGLEVLGLVSRVWSSLIHLLRAFALISASWGSPLLRVLIPLHLGRHR